MPVDDGGPVHPKKWHVADKAGNLVPMDSGGMTLRDYFAAAALTGCLANQYTRNESGNRDTEYFLAIADAVYAVADAMIIARAKEPPDANQ